MGVAMGNRFRTKFTRKWIPMALAAVTAVSVLTLPGAALGADMHPSDADFGYTYNPDTQEIGFWFGPEDVEADCAWSDVAVDESGLDSVEETESHCIVLDVAGPNGQVNHGTIVSAFVHGLDDLIKATGYEGPRGRFVSEVARGDHGKRDHKVKASSGEDGEVELEVVTSDSGDRVPPPWVQEKKDSRPDRGRGNHKNG
jgi:hypothetical protein